jgi:glutamine cyclotransferase
MKQWIIAALLITLIITFSLVSYVALSNHPSSKETLSYTYSVINKFPHDTDAFTEGLVFENGFLYESTGLNGCSTLRKVELETGRILQLYSLPSQFFGEGITIFGDKIIQLTWQSQSGFVYDKDSFDILEEFRYGGEGWGITHDDNKLIMSNGSATLTFLDPDTYKVLGEVQVHDGNTPVTNLNELEYVKGDVYANVWHQDRIAIISIQTGQVKGWINLAGLYHSDNADPENVLNGIAYDPQGERLFVTGKRWSQLFEIKLNPTG